MPPKLCQQPRKPVKSQGFSTTGGRIHVAIMQEPEEIVLLEEDVALRKIILE